MGSAEQMVQNRFIEDLIIPSWPLWNATGTINADRFSTQTMAISIKSTVKSPLIELSVA